MAVETFESVVSSDTEEVVFDLAQSPGEILGSIYINIDDDEDSTNGFNTVNETGDVLTLRFYIRGNDDLLKLTDFTSIENPSKQQLVPISEILTRGRDLQVTAEVDTFRDNFRITGHYEELLVGSDAVSVIPEAVIVFDANDNKIHWKARIEKEGADSIIPDPNEATLKVFNHQNVQVGSTQTSSNPSSEGVFSGSFEIDPANIEPNRAGYYIVEIDNGGNVYKRLFDFWFTL